MTEELLKELILENLGLIGSDIAIKKPRISYGDLILSLITYGSIAKASVNLGITDNALEHQISRNLRSIFPQKDRAVPWDIALLGVIDQKRCPSCKKIKTLVEFSTRSECKECACQVAKEKHKEDPVPGNLRSKNHYVNNKEGYIARAIQRRTRRKLATPMWADLNKLKEIYRDCPKGMHVDHIIPLQGELVSGLHIETNLQYLSAEDNLAKSNIYEV